MYSESSTSNKFIYHAGEFSHNIVAFQVDFLIKISDDLAQFIYVANHQLLTTLSIMKASSLTFL